ncbi:MAG: ABC transporter ATP-binding protein [Trueperaceae bacterium]|nr:ABC transporter ATP-binding protein [Trueperaceae bacterium]
MIKLEHVVKAYGEQEVLKDISFEIAKGELVVLIGPSGCGKSTLLRLINRMIELSGGRILIKDRDTRTLDPVSLRLGIGYVIQSIGLFSHMTIFENVEVVPSLLQQNKKLRRERARELLDMMGLEPAQYGQRYPKELSGGQQQRVGIARAIAADPEIMLMDEPFSAVDPITREQLQDHFLGLKTQIDKTIVFVTHDVDEAVKLGDRICILNQGLVQQIDSPKALLHKPANDFVASFLGEDRELKRLSRIPVTDVMRSGAHPEARTIEKHKSAKDALNRLLAGENSLNVIDDQNSIIGTVNLQDLQG